MIGDNIWPMASANRATTTAGRGFLRSRSCWRRSWGCWRAIRSKAGQAHHFGQAATVIGNGDGATILWLANRNIMGDRRIDNPEYSPAWACW
jgi:hypothetical protein